MNTLMDFRYAGNLVTQCHEARVPQAGHLPRAICLPSRDCKWPAAWISRASLKKNLSTHACECYVGPVGAKVCYLAATIMLPLPQLEGKAQLAIQPAQLDNAMHCNCHS
jgi:hypothetical protein